MRYNEKRTKYFPEKPCKFGHADGRYVNSGACVGCRSGYTKAAWIGIKRRRIARRMALINVNYNVHKDDVETLDAFVAALVQARNWENNDDY